MHLLLAQKGALADADEAVDLGQTPADLLFLSAADTELASLSLALKSLDNPPQVPLQAQRRILCGPPAIHV